MKPTAYFPFAEIVPTPEYLDHGVIASPAQQASHPYFSDTTPLGGVQGDDDMY
jgi:hypothetical protein